MKKKRRIKELIEQYKAISFILIMFLTILFVRFVVFIYDPNPFIGGFELHHFDYGLIILMITVLFMLFRKYNWTYLPLIAISFGLLADQWWYIRSNMVRPTVPWIENWLNTLPSVLIILVIFIILIILLNQKRKNEA